MGTFYRNNDNEQVTKETFPTLLSSLFKYMQDHAGSAVNGFIKSGLFPIDMTKIPRQKIVLSTTVAVIPRPVPVRKPEPVTPHSAMRRAIATTLAPKRLMETAKKPRRRVQREGGECLSEQSVLKRMEEADNERRAKMNKKVISGSKVTKKLPVVKNDTAPEEAEIKINNPIPKMKKKAISGRGKVTKKRRVVKIEPTLEDEDIEITDPITPPKANIARNAGLIVVGKGFENEDFIPQRSPVSVTPVRKLRSSSRLTVNGWEK